MRFIIAGSRIIDNEKLVLEIIDKFVDENKLNIQTILSGCAEGVDTLGEIWANNKQISIKKYPADWDRYGRSAGYIRNELMAQNADGLIAIIKNNSKGTRHMINLAKKYNLLVFVKEI
jgi:hypothetical protein